MMLLLQVEAMVNMEWPPCKRMVVGSTPTTGSTLTSGFSRYKIINCDLVVRTEADARLRLPERASSVPSAAEQAPADLGVPDLLVLAESGLTVEGPFVLGPGHIEVGVVVPVEVGLDRPVGA